MFVELHILQSFAPSNLNRDDTNNPKDAQFGGVRRARISSQAIKRAIRQEPSFAETTKAENGTRTRYLSRSLTTLLVEAGKAEDKAKDAVAEFAKSLFSEVDKNSGRTNVLIYLSSEEQKQISELLLASWEQIEKGKFGFDVAAKGWVKATKERTSAPDIAMFGRMLANEPALNLDAACQVAHAISTHRVDMDMDFFTAVDDLQRNEETGAGMMGVTAFNSACFYRYHRIDWEQLLKNLDKDVGLARRAVEGFLRAAARAIPTGKQNSFAAQNPPSFLLGVVREDGQSWSLVNAFEKPVRADREGGLLTPSIKELDTYWGRLNKAYGNGNVNAVALALEAETEVKELNAGLVNDFETWVQAVLKQLPKA